MRLISCYIAGFGKFVDRSFDLSADLTNVKEENGWGKTTFADFIKCMLYGMDGGRSKSVGANDRIKYEPWQGGVFGGSLVFSYAGRTYRIERTFGKTPSGDVVRLYDGNNMLSYDFGDRIERLGEVLLGVDRESHQRSVYVPQSEIVTDGLPDDMKGRLLALLGDNGRENGAKGAIERLDAAERNLRAKRRPSKGKLDEIDERLETLARAKNACDEYAAATRQTKGEIAQKEREIAALGEKLNVVEREMQRYSRLNESAARAEARRNLQLRMDETSAEIAALQTFFGKVEPTTINVVGLQKAVTDFYALKAEFASVEEKLRETETLVREKRALENQLASCENAQRSYELVLQKNSKMDGAGMRRTHSSKKNPPKGKRTGFWLFVCLFMAILGATQTPTRPALGYILLGIGGVGLLISLVKLLPKGGKKNNEDDIDTDVSLHYNETQAEVSRIRARLIEFAPDLEFCHEQYTQQHGEIKNRLRGLENAICAFLDNFRFEELYDYRVALSAIKENITKYERNRAAMQEYEKQLSGLKEDGEENATRYDISALQRQKQDLEREKEGLVDERARLKAQLEDQENRADKADIEAEEERLLAEKERLEHRLYVVRTAREMLLRAQENMATRYLAPVEKSCREYLKQFDEKYQPLRFSADGAPLMEVVGQMRSLDYYSLGEKELVDFCTRIALVDALYQKELPTLILDDPFANFDDKKTEKAKKFVKELSKRYQIVYLTCKSDRKV